jgi:CDP-diacylglycerol---glycerol-3-phosphate 3-phosphatidyltransferase
MKLVIIPQIIKENFKKLLNPIIKLFVKYHLNPNYLTTFSLVISLFSAYQFAAGSARAGAILLLLGGIFDMVDGAVARASNRVTRFGALYDSTLDRYAEIIVFLGIGYRLLNAYFADAKTSLLISVAVLIAATGSIMVSYVRARAEGLGMECKVGLMQRPERLVIISLGGLISNTALLIAVIIIAALANFTAVQRMSHIWSTENEKRWSKLPSDIDHE